MGQNASNAANAQIEVTVKFVMAGKAEIKVHAPAACTVRGLKTIIAEKSEIFPEKQLLLYNDNELKDDDAKISNYGIVADCTVTMSVNIVTGMNMGGNLTTILYMPVTLPQDTEGLRNTVKTMTTVKGKSQSFIYPYGAKKIQKPTVSAQHTWTPEKHLEIELTRNRMKALMRRKNKSKLLSPASCSPSDGGSIISSRLHSPPSEPASKALLTPVGSMENPVSEEDIEVTDKELKLFFEPMETLDQWKRFKRKLMVQPPQNIQELEELKKRVSLVEKTTCKTCGKKIPASEQAIRCRCKLLFCRKHRDPKSHLCKIDYKQAGRKKIHKLMPKVGDGGARKGKPELENM